VPVYLSDYGTYMDIKVVSHLVEKPMFRILQDKFLRRPFVLKRE
jgi:hypothetical protein